MRTWWAAFEKYYKPGLPKMKRLRMVAYADENARVAALQAGDVDMIEYVPCQSMGTIQSDPKLKLSTVNGPYMALDFNGGAGPFKDVRLRLAVAHAVKREDIVRRHSLAGVRSWRDCRSLRAVRTTMKTTRTRGRMIQAWPRS
jgi:ABC-type transport system substrate-binding protein